MLHRTYLIPLFAATVWATGALLAPPEDPTEVGAADGMASAQLAYNARYPDRVYGFDEAEQADYRRSWNRGYDHAWGLAEAAYPEPPVDPPEPPVDPGGRPSWAEVPETPSVIVSRTEVDFLGSDRDHLDESRANDWASLSWALNHSEPGDVILVSEDYMGWHGQPYFGGPQNWEKSITTRVEDVTILAGDYGATKIGGLRFNAQHGGWDGIRLMGFEVVNGGGLNPVHVDQHTRGGSIHLVDCLFSGTKKVAGGKRAKWWIRAHGGCDLYCYNLGALEPAQEHFVYVDNPGDLHVAVLHVLWDDPNLAFGRTLIQVAGRVDSSPAPEEWGTVVIEDIDARGMVDISANGGSVFTIANFPGDITLRRLKFHKEWDGAYEGGGGIAIWDPTNYGGGFPDEQGYRNGDVLLEDIDITIEKSSRAIAQIHNARSVTMRNVRFAGSRPWVEYTGMYAMGLKVGFHKFPQGSLTMDETSQALEVRRYEVYNDKSRYTVFTDAEKANGIPAREQ